MPYDSLVSRTDADALIPEDAAREIFQAATEASSVQRLARRLPNMARAQRRLPVINALPQAYFVNGDTGMKQTTEQTWRNVFINAEELAVIIPIPEAVLDDADYDIWAEIRPHAAEAFGKAFDQAVLYGTNAPSDWPDDILTQATAASHVVERGTLGQDTDLYDELLGENGTIAKIEEDGYMATGHIGALSLRAALRGLRDKDGNPIFKTVQRDGVQGSSRYELDGEPILFPRNGGVDPAQSLLVSGDFSQLVWAVRQDVTAKVLTEAVITDNENNIVYNLAQQDMVALRLVFRCGWALPNPTNRVNEDAESRFPFAVLAPEGS